MNIFCLFSSESSKRHQDIIQLNLPWNQMSPSLHNLSKSPALHAPRLIICSYEEMKASSSVSLNKLVAHSIYKTISSFIVLFLLNISQRNFFQQPGQNLTHLGSFCLGHLWELLQFLLNLQKWINFLLSYAALLQNSTGLTGYIRMH